MVQVMNGAMTSNGACQPTVTLLFRVIREFRG